MMAVYLISGSTGLVGSAVLQSLSSRGDVVMTIGRSLPSSQPKDQHIFFDAMEDSGVPHIPGEVDYIAHLAQSREYKSLPVSAVNVFRVNVAYSFALLEAGRRAGVSGFFLASSGGVYQSSAFDINESSGVTSAPDLYLASKLASEVTASGFSSFFPVSIGRIFYPFGPGQQLPGLIARLVTKILSGEEIDVPSEGDIEIPILSSVEVARVIAVLFDTGFSGVLNIAGSETLSLRQIATDLATGLGAQARFCLSPSLKPQRTSCDTRRMREVAGAIEENPSLRLREDARQIALSIR